MKILTLNECGLVAGGLREMSGTHMRTSERYHNPARGPMGVGMGMKTGTGMSMGYCPPTEPAATGGNHSMMGGCGPGDYRGGGYSGYLGDIGSSSNYGSPSGAYGGTVTFGSQYDDSPVQSGDTLIVGNGNTADIYEKSAEIATGTIEVKNGITDIVEGTVMTLGSDGVFSIPGAVYILTGIVDLGIGMIELHKGESRNGATPPGGEPDSVHREPQQKNALGGMHVAAEVA